MITTPVISNSSPLISLEHIGQLHLIEHLFGKIIIPPAVVNEVGFKPGVPPWIESRGLMQPIGPRILRASLGAGESEAISLALETQALHLSMVGTLGILLAAKRRKLLPVVRPSLDALLQRDFRISQQLYEQILSDAGENG